MTGYWYFRLFQCGILNQLNHMNIIDIDYDDATNKRKIHIIERKNWIGWKEAIRFDRFK